LQAEDFSTASKLSQSRETSHSITLQVRQALLINYSVFFSHCGPVLAQKNYR
jgi:hypothetical protein